MGSPAMDLLSFPRLHELFRFIALNSRSVFRIQFTISIGIILKIHYLFVNIQCFHDLVPRFTMKLLYFPWIHYEFTIYFANLLWIHYRSGEILWIHYEIIIFFMHSLWIHYLFCEFTMNSLPIRGDTVNSLSISRIHY